MAARPTIVRAKIPPSELEDHQDAPFETSLLGAIAALELRLVVPLALPREHRLDDLVVTGTVTLASGRVHQFHSVTIQPGGVLTTDAWDAASGTGGELRLLIVHRLDIAINGRIDLTGLGYRGGRSNGLDGKNSDAGESITGRGTASSLLNGGGGGGGFNNAVMGSVGGGGAGHALPGQDAPHNTYRGTVSVGGLGGAAYGTPTIPDDGVYKGSGGGAGAGHAGSLGGDGGAGGGALWVQAQTVRNKGAIACNGDDGEAGTGNYTSGGGGGSGGSIKLLAALFETFGSVQALGGAAGAAGYGSACRLCHCHKVACVL